MEWIRVAGVYAPALVERAQAITQSLTREAHPRAWASNSGRSRAQAITQSLTREASVAGVYAPALVERVTAALPPVIVVRVAGVYAPALVERRQTARALRGTTLHVSPGFTPPALVERSSTRELARCRIAFGKGVAGVYAPALVERSRSSARIFL